MPPFATVTIHKSQWPEALACELRDNLRAGRVNHKFLYESPRQVRQWLRLHEEYSPARREAEFDSTYTAAFGAVLEQLGPEPLHLIGLGCGGGQKEASLLRHLAASQRKLSFTATDVSVGMAITSLKAAWDHLEQSHCFGLVCDLALADDLEIYLDVQTMPGARRILTFFGMIPNFEPAVTQRLLKRLVRPGDILLCSANLAPGPDYRNGVEAVLAQYDNSATRKWLGLLIADLGVDPGAGELRFAINESPADSGLLRIEANFEFQHDATAMVECDSFEFGSGSRLGVIFSYRHTPETLNELFCGASLNLKKSWLSKSGEEGVFMIQC